MINYQCLWLERALVCSHLCVTKTLRWHLLVCMRSVELYQSAVSDLLDAACYSPVLCLSFCIGISLTKFAIWTKHIVLSADSISPVSFHGKYFFFVVIHEIYTFYIFCFLDCISISEHCMFRLQWETLKKSFVKFDLHLHFFYPFSYPALIWWTLQA